MEENKEDLKWFEKYQKVKTFFKIMHFQIETLSNQLSEARCKVKKKNDTIARLEREASEFKKSQEITELKKKIHTLEVQLKKAKRVNAELRERLEKR